MPKKQKDVYKFRFFYKKHLPYNIWLIHNILKLSIEQKNT